ncbi:GNAT family N-acetyltransferase [Bacillus salitolerans]|uniref:GNAT family N-acetyltransferase n=1 Tax=Bacillus salitolerans TaxID=1437434 RepID=A0ABW4LLG7_9BACI
MITLHKADSTNELQEIYHLRYMVYATEMKKNIHSSTEQLFDQYDEWGINYYALDGTKLVGCIRLNVGFAHQFDNVWHERMAVPGLFDNNPKIGLVSKLLIHPEYRSTNVMFSLVKLGYQTLLDLEVQMNFITCAPSLIRLYERLGFIRYRHHYIDKELGFLAPLLLFPRDRQYLKEISSPLWRIGRKIENNLNDHSVKRNLLSTLPEYCSKIISADSVYEIVNNLVGFQNISVFESFSYDEILLILEGAVLIHSKIGDPIITKGEFDNELFILLEGDLLAENSKIDIGEPLSVDPFLKGSHHTINIITKIDSTFLVVSRKNVMGLVVRKRELYNKLIENISEYSSQKIV